jgi:hypothetical protein
MLIYLEAVKVSIVSCRNSCVGGLNAVFERANVLQRRNKNITFH